MKETGAKGGVGWKNIYLLTHIDEVNFQRSTILQEWCDNVAFPKVWSSLTRYFEENKYWGEGMDPVFKNGQ